MSLWNRTNSNRATTGTRDIRTDAELVRAARQGDKRAFVAIVARHQSMVCGIALGVLGDFAASEDAGQEAFLTAWRKIQELREPEKLRAWLAQIARHAALMQLRKRRGHDDLEEAAALPDGSLAPDEATATEEEAALVRDSLSRLPESYRVPLVLFYRDGQSVRAVAEALSISEDAVKQRLARGREMLREQMSGLVETVLTRTGPTPVFTMGVAMAIGALMAPAAMAGAAFATSAAAAGTTSSTLSSQLVTAMSTTKTCVITAVAVAAVCIPVGYHITPGFTPGQSFTRDELSGAGLSSNATKAPPSFENSAIFAEWRRLHEIHGTTAEAMPALYDAIAAIEDPFRRRSFRAALIAEWVQVDPVGGFNFFQTQRDGSQRNLFFQEWLARDVHGAVDTLLGSDVRWEYVPGDALKEIAHKLPARAIELIERLPKPTSHWDTRVRDTFATIAERDLASARASAEALQGANREQALAGVANAWARRDIDAAVKWARSLPEGIDRDEVIRGALFGRATVDPVSALNLVGLVPPGGRQNYFADTTGARVLREAGVSDYDGTVAWLAANPGSLGHDDLMGIANVVSEKLNADPASFLNRHAADNSLAAIMPAINSALMNDSGGQRGAVWDWLRTQPQTEATKALRQHVLNSASYQDPELALRLASELPRTPDGEAQIQTLVNGLFNGGQMLHRFEKLIEQAPERLRQPIIESAFQQLREDTFTDASTWIARLSMLPESSRARATENIARAWAHQAPDEAAAWVNTLAAGATRSDATAAIVSSWGQKDARGAGDWIAAMPASMERDRCAGQLAMAVADRQPAEALTWIMTIANAAERERVAMQTAQIMSARQPELARDWIQTAPLSAENKARLRTNLERVHSSSPQSTAP